MSALQATLDATADGILVVDELGKVVSFNRRFSEMWRMPLERVATWSDDEAIAFVLDQLKDPGRFVTKVMEVYAHPDEESHDRLWEQAVRSLGIEPATLIPTQGVN